MDQKGCDPEGISGQEMLRIEKILVSLLQEKDGITDTETRAEARISRRQQELSWIKEAQDEMQ